jgi:DNA-binding transcriptional ArsR family regulator
MAGLIDCRRQGKHNFYRLAPGKLEEVLDRIFAGKPPADRRIRLGKYLLSCLD